MSYKPFYWQYLHFGRKTKCKYTRFFQIKKQKTSLFFQISLFFCCFARFLTLWYWFFLLFCTKSNYWMTQQPQDHNERPLCILLHVCSKTECAARQNIVCKRDGCSHTSRMDPEGIPNKINFFAWSNSLHAMSLHACNLIMKKWLPQSQGEIGIRKAASIL